MFRTEDTQSFTVSAVGGIEKITEHVVAFNLSLENGTERCLALEFIETALHVTDGSAHRQTVSARDTIDGGRFGFTVAHFVRFVVRIVNSETLHFGRYRINFLI